MWLLEASVARERVAVGRWWSGTAEARASLAVFKAVCSISVQSSCTRPVLAGVSGRSILAMPGRKRR